MTLVDLEVCDSRFVFLFRCVFFFLLSLSFCFCLVCWFILFFSVVLNPVVLELAETRHPILEVLASRAPTLLQNGFWGQVELRQAAILGHDRVFL